MTIVCAQRDDTGVTITADTQMTYEQGMIDRVDKIFDIEHDYQFFGCGDTDTLSLMYSFAHERRPASSIISVTKWILDFQSFHEVNTGVKPDDVAYILLLENDAFLIQGLHVRLIDDYAAIGSGAIYALPWLEHGASTKMACQIATQFDAFCSEPLIDYRFTFTKKE